MTAGKIGNTDITSITPQAGHTQRTTQDAFRRSSKLIPPPLNRLYNARREESITCQETATGTYEAILGNDPVFLEPSSRKGQIIDFWI